MTDAAKGVQAFSVARSGNKVKPEGEKDKKEGRVLSLDDFSTILFALFTNVYVPAAAHYASTLYRDKEEAAEVEEEEIHRISFRIPVIKSIGIFSGNSRRGETTHQ
ncbi:hypothetical protein PanWU01x14_245620 [Parasponia andersonii]|uniref:Uncharacterized protein n=1 Tax=Parasponia andersonii TaxID=3476 RepID=A0A2P5BEG4_PARAD|nr:hypothetical protein PanWU01x14_245620 [Parasponia andersonii]